jgi:hypothetical protein
MAKKSDKGKDGPVPTATQNFFEKYGKAATLSSITGRLLKFNKFGEYRAGREEEQIKHGTRLAVYMDSLCVGYQLWEDGRPTDKIMGPIRDGFVPPDKKTLSHRDKSKWETDDEGEPRDPWQFTNTLVLVDPETKDLFTFTTSSKGGLNAVGHLALKYGEHMRQKPDEAPIIELGGGSYKHPNKKYGEIRFPILKRVDWIPVDKLPPLDDGEGPLQLDPPPDEDDTGGTQVSF